MVKIFMEGGPMMLPLAVVALVLLGLTIRTMVELIARRAADTAVLENGLDGLLFWGAVAIVIGVLGQVSGTYKSFAYMADHGLRSFAALWTGLAEGLISTIAGFTLLAVAGALWFVLRWWYRGIRPTVQ
jgi:hypothetical protein